MTTLIHSLSRRLPSSLFTLSPGDGGFSDLRTLPGTWFRRARQRHQLRREIGSDPQRLKRLELDIGLAPGTLRREMSKPFWIA